MVFELLSLFIPRDIKSKNILVKDNGQCCIGDLGHAVRNNKLKIDAGPGKLVS